jgi:NAD-specific glutamate dehydrogenase
LAKIINDSGVGAEKVINTFFRLGEELNIFWLYQLIDKIAIDDNWKRKNKKMLVASIENYHVKALKHYLSREQKEGGVVDVLPESKHYLEMVHLAKSKPVYNFSMATVLASQLGDLVQL